MTPKTLPRITRHPALVNLSRDHHFGLLLVWKINKGIQLNITPDRIAAYVTYFFTSDLQAHFAEEEQVVFTLLPEDDPMRVRAQEEHQHIRKLLTHVQEKDCQYEILSVFAAALEQHIRFEERMLFNHIQDVLPEDALDALSAIAPHTGKDPDLGWTDHFWVSDVYHPTQRKPNG